MLQLKPSKVKRKCEPTTQAKYVISQLICFCQRGASKLPAGRSTGATLDTFPANHIKRGGQESNDQCEDSFEMSLHQ
jgi:hypothetical protein